MKKIEKAVSDYEKLKKREKWCNQCHAQDDCEDKEKFLESEETTCTWYA